MKAKEETLDHYGGLPYTVEVGTTRMAGSRRSSSFQGA